MHRTSWILCEFLSPEARNCTAGVQLKASANQFSTWPALSAEETSQLFLKNILSQVPKIGAYSSRMSIHILARLSAQGAWPSLCAHRNDSPTVQSFTPIVLSQHLPVPLWLTHCPHCPIICVGEEYAFLVALWQPAGIPTCSLGGQNYCPMD